MTDNEWDRAREKLQADALLRSADAVPGAHLQHFAEQMVKTVEVFKLNREQLRVALNPDIDPDGPGGRDDDNRKARHRDYVEARAQLLADARFLADQAEREIADEINNG